MTDEEKKELQKIIEYADFLKNLKKSHKNTSAVLVAEAKLGMALMEAWDQGKLLFVGNTESYVHKKRGSEYRHILTGNVQAATRPLNEGDTAIIYQDDNGVVWIREKGEFLDGRFELQK
jgi:hypothetical protein